MNRILYLFCAFVCRYIDDIMIFSKTLNEYVSHLHQLFQLFQKLDINLKFKKFFLDYFTVTFLDQWINVLDLIIISKKIQIIADLQFSLTLKILKIYLDLTEWLCFYILYYIQITASLQTCKMALVKTSSAKEKVWKQQICQVSLNKSIKKELHAFETLQKLFAQSIFFVHFDSDQQLYINVNAFKQYEFDTVVYHVKNDSKSISINVKIIKFSHHKIQSIFFLNKLLTLAEQNYWFMKIEMADLIWMIQKTKHFIESASNSIIVFTDHSAMMLIVCQTHLTMTVNTNKLNL